MSPYVLVALLLGPEFPSLLGGLLGLAILIPATQAGFLVPKDTWDFPPREEWDKGWMSDMEISLESLTTRKPMNLVLAWVPYVLVAVVLVLSRLPQLPLGGWLNSVAIEWTDIFGTGITGSSAPLYLPGAMLIFVVIITFFLHRMTSKELGDAVKESSKILLGAGFVLIFTIPMVRVYINSGINAAGYASMPLAMAQWVASNVGHVWPFFAPFIGGLGAFIAGSNTVSNMTFSAFQNGVAQALKLSRCSPTRVRSPSRDTCSRSERRTRNRMRATCAASGPSSSRAAGSSGSRWMQWWRCSTASSSGRVFPSTGCCCSTCPRPRWSAA